MCSLCGVLGGQRHWTESASNPQVFERRAEPHTRRRERQQRVRLVNRVLRHYGLTLSDWSGGSYVLRGGTGRTAILANLSELWTAAETLGRSPCDPLDPELLAALADAPGPAP